MADKELSAREWVVLGTFFVFMVVGFILFVWGVYWLREIAFEFLSEHPIFILILVALIAWALYTDHQEKQQVKKEELTKPLTVNDSNDNSQNETLDNSNISNSRVENTPLIDETSIQLELPMSEIAPEETFSDENITPIGEKTMLSLYDYTSFTLAKVPEYQRTEYVKSIENKLKLASLITTEDEVYQKTEDFRKAYTAVTTGNVQLLEYPINLLMKKFESESWKICYEFGAYLTVLFKNTEDPLHLELAAKYIAVSTALISIGNQRINLEEGTEENLAVCVIFFKIADVSTLVAEAAFAQRLNLAHQVNQLNN